jgi:hypothetical protein
MISHVALDSRLQHSSFLRLCLGLNAGSSLWSCHSILFLASLSRLATYIAAYGGLCTVMSNLRCCAVPAARDLDVDAIIDSIFAPSASGILPHNVQLPQMIDLLTDLWETEGQFPLFHLLTIVRYMFATARLLLSALSRLATAPPTS